MTHLSIPRKLYQRAERLASARHQDVLTLLDELLTCLEIDEQSDEFQMAQEEAAYQILLPTLRQSHLGQYVALYQGQLIDHDGDELSLLERIEQQFPHKVVLIKQVSDQPEPVLTVRSPRLLAEE